VAAAAQASQTPVQRIGHINAAPGLWLLNTSGARVALRPQGFDHFG
jgi:thiamine-monophosphate kinase